MLVCHEVVPIESHGASRDSIGGSAVLPSLQEFPHCLCGRRMVLYFQFDIRDDFGLPIQGDCHFSCFVCPDHNGIPQSYGTTLPSEYWANTHDPHRSEFKSLKTPRQYASYKLFLHQGAVEQTVHPPDEVLVQRALEFRRLEEQVEEREHPDRPRVTAMSHDGYLGWSAHDVEVYTGLDLFKVGGHPTRVEHVPSHVCSCGAPMVFLCQVPYPDEVFKLVSGSTYKEAHNGLFLNNLVHFFVCQRQCHPNAVHASVDG